MLTSAKNQKVVAAVRLKKRTLREEEHRFLVEGAQAVAEALAEDGRLLSLFVSDELDPLAVRARQTGVPVEQVSERVMERLTSTVTPQGVVGIAAFVDVGIDDLMPPGAVAVLHEVRDPGNAGTILRSADAAGAAGVVFAGSSVDAYNPKGVRASAGSIFHVPVVRDVGTEDALASLRAKGLAVIAMDMHGDEDLFEAELPRSSAFLFGNEAHGLPSELLDGCRSPRAGSARGARRESEPRRRGDGVPVRVGAPRPRIRRDARAAGRGRGARHPVAAHGDEGIRLRARASVGWT